MVHFYVKTSPNLIMVGRGWSFSGRFEKLAFWSSVHICGHLWSGAIIFRGKTIFDSYNSFAIKKKRLNVCGALCDDYKKCKFCQLKKRKK